MADIFISYAREDRERAKQLAETLTQRGWSVWWDSLIYAGEPFNRLIEKELNEARCVIVLWSRHSIESNYVRNEATAADERGALVPVLIDDARVPLPFRHLHTTQIEDVDHIIESIRSLVPPGNAEVPQAAQAAIPAPAPSRRTTRTNLFAPRIFISYARADAPLAHAVRDALAKRGFRVFVDEAMLGGEDYVRRLTGEIAEAEALVALLTPASVSSEWCVAEWYWAHARGLRVIPIRFGPIGDELPEPIRLLEQRIHFLQPADIADYDRVAADLAEQLDGVRRARRGRVAWISAAVIVALAITGAIALAVANRFEAALRNRARNDAINQVVRSSQPLAGSEIARISGSFAGDEQLLGTALAIASDSTRPDPARWNATMLSSHLLQRAKPERRWFVRDTNWRNGTLEGAKVADVTFYSGTVDRLTMKDSTLAAVHWGAPDRFTLSNASFRNVQFAAGGFDRTNAIGVSFDDCIFRGTEIDVTNFALVNFRSPADPAHPTLVAAGRQTILENCVVVNRNVPAAPNVMDLGDPAEDVRFTDVVFSGVRFRGYIQPEWFQRCPFDRCTLPSSVTPASLEARDNIVSDCTQSDESID